MRCRLFLRFKMDRAASVRSCPAPGRSREHSDFTGRCVFLRERTFRTFSYFDLEGARVVRSAYLRTYMTRSMVMVRARWKSGLYPDMPIAVRYGE